MLVSCQMCVKKSKVAPNDATALCGPSVAVDASLSSQCFSRESAINIEGS